VREKRAGFPGTDNHAPDDSVFLSRYDVFRLTGEKQFTAQRRELDAMKIKYVTAATGEPLVREEKQRGVEPPVVGDRNINWGALKTPPRASMTLDELRAKRAKEVADGRVARKTNEVAAQLAEHAADPASSQAKFEASRAASRAKWKSDRAARLARHGVEKTKDGGT